MVVGYRSSLTNAVVFPNLNAEMRTDSAFRANEYTLHQKYDSPLTDLPIDMINDFPIGDELHLINLGVMKRLLEGYRMGTLTNVDAKWSHFEKSQISKYLDETKGPLEIRSQRSIRNLNEIANWKGREYRFFLLYLSIPIFRCFLKEHLFNHFLLLFCAITICSNENHLRVHIDIADECIKHYIKGYKQLYGDQHITSNVHNLSHLIDDVKRFGTLDSFSAYPFESMLGKIKRMIKTGSLPLSQIAKRLIEQNTYLSSQKKDLSSVSEIEFKPKFKKMVQIHDVEVLAKQKIINLAKNNKLDIYSKIELEKFTIDCSNDDDKWILTKKNEIVNIHCVFVMIDNKFYLCGKKLKNICDIFNLPFPSSHLFMFESKNSNNFGDYGIFTIEEIRAKMFKLKTISLDSGNINSDLFIPIVHTVEE